MKKCDKDCKYADVENNVCTYKIVLSRSCLKDSLDQECPAYCAKPITSMAECKDECDKWKTCTGSEGKSYGVSLTKIIGKNSDDMTPEELEKCKPRVECIKRHREFVECMRDLSIK